jgi:hypothetical protein
VLAGSLFGECLLGADEDGGDEAKFNAVSTWPGLNREWIGNDR